MINTHHAVHLKWQESKCLFDLALHGAYLIAYIVIVVIVIILFIASFTISTALTMKCTRYKVLNTIWPQGRLSLDRNLTVRTYNFKNVSPFIFSGDGPDGGGCAAVNSLSQSTRPAYCQTEERTHGK